MNPKKHDWFKISFILIFLSSFIMVCIGYALKQVRMENAQLQAFLDVASNVQTDFENSLSVYTEDISANSEYLFSLRPESESGYIGFITQVEDVASTLGLVLEVQTEERSLKPDETGSYYVDYHLKFYSNVDQLWSFVKQLEGLPYFLRVMEVDFQSLEKVESAESLLPNVALTLRLYVQ